MVDSRLILLFLVGVLVFVAPTVRRHREAEQRKQCVSHQKNYGTALEMYSTDFLGRYPTSPRLLTPSYLRELPRCPTNESDYYVVTASNPDLYTIICRGYHP